MNGLIGVPVHQRFGSGTRAIAKCRCGAVGEASPVKAVPGAGTKAIGSSVYGEPDHGGGHGSSGASHAAGASAAPAQPIAVGPRGGARGTW